MDKATGASIEYLQRKLRVSHPDGKTDKGGRWYPSDTESCTCCSSMRSPTRSYPWSLMTHCRTLKHVCVLYGVDEKEVRFYLSKKGLPLLVGSGNPWMESYLEGKLKSLNNKGVHTA